MDLFHTIRRGPIVNHFRFGPHTGSVCSNSSTSSSNHWQRNGLLLTAANYCGSGDIQSADASEIARRDFLIRFSVTAFRNRLAQQIPKLVFQISKLYSILRTFWTSNARDDGGQIQIENAAVTTLSLFRNTKHALRLVVVPHCLNLTVGAAGGFQIYTRLFIDGKESHGGPVLRSHVGDRSAVCYRKACSSLTVKLDKFADHLCLAKHLGYAQNQVCRRNTFLQASIKMNTNDVRSQKVNRLTQHRGLCFDSAHSPTDDSQTIDHGRMRVRTDQRIWKVKAVLFPNTARQILQIDLMTNANSRRNNSEAVKCLRSPLQKLVTRIVPPELHPNVFLKRIPCA